MISMLKFMYFNIRPKMNNSNLIRIYTESGILVKRINIMR